MAMPWGTQDSSAVAIHGDVRACGGQTGKAPSAAADKEGARGRHGERPVQRGEKGDHQKNKGGETSGVQGDDGGRDASVVAHVSPGVGGEEGGREASGVAENPRGSHQGLGGEVKSPQGTDTPRVAEFPRGGRNPRRDHSDLG